jgi:hypothetical protein
MIRRRRRNLLPLVERMQRARERAERLNQRRCADCGAICPNGIRGPGSIGACTRCGGLPALY